MATLKLALKLSATGHFKQEDKSGKPYFLHCVAVMSMLPKYDEELYTIAIMHDLIEDTDMTIAKLGAYGFSIRVLDALTLLTHGVGQSYDSYIKAIGTNKDATMVKLCDLRHNSDILRLKGLTDKDFKRTMKYHKAFSYLNSLYEDTNIGQ